MVYIDRNGRVLDRRPWDLNRVLEIFTSVWFLVLHFFTTLFAPFRTDSRGGRNGRGGSWGSGGGGGGGGGSWGSGGGGGGNSGGNGGIRPNRRIGRITNSMDCNIPGGG